MANVYFTIQKESETELQVKDSRFISWLAPANGRQQAEEIIRARSQRFTDATHNCFALRILSASGTVERFSDDREPAGSAGKPMLQTLAGHQLVNVAAVVTRYFGGSKLGIGGLRRAYREAVRETIQTASLRQIFQTVKLEIEYSYEDSSLIERLLGRFRVREMDAEYQTTVKRRLEILASEENKFMHELNELSAGRIQARMIKDD